MKKNQSVNVPLRVAKKISSVVILIIAVILLFSGCNNKSVFYRMIRYGNSDINDFRKFPSRQIRQSNNPFLFSGSDSISFNSFNEFKVKKNLNSFLAINNTLAFLVLHNDTLAYETYFSGYNGSSPVQFFSMTKSIIALLIGCAIDDKLIGSEDDNVTRYIPELRKKGFGNITIYDLLEMRAPVNYTENDSPFGKHAKFYYTSYLEKEILKLTADEKRGKEFVYKSCNYALLSLILKRVLQKESISNYLQRRIWEPIGMENPAIWTIDNENNGIEKGWCCLAGTARDFTKISKLYLQQGSWGGKQIVSENWIKKTLASLSKENKVMVYSYGWWLYPKRNAFAAIGKGGQFSYSCLSKDITIIRLGKNMGGMDREEWLALFDKIAKSLSVENK